jgi:hypothetical protein
MANTQPYPQRAQACFPIQHKYIYIVHKSGTAKTRHRNKKHKEHAAILTRLQKLGIKFTDNLKTNTMPSNSEKKAALNDALLNITMK